jgi:hypothetical protein
MFEGLDGINRTLRQISRPGWSIAGKLDAPAVNHPALCVVDAHGLLDRVDCACTFAFDGSQPVIGSGRQQVAGSK